MSEEDETFEHYPKKFHTCCTVDCNDDCGGCCDGDCGETDEESNGVGWDCPGEDDHAGGGEMTCFTCNRLINAQKETAIISIVRHGRFYSA